MKISFDKKNPTEASIAIKIEEADYRDRVAKQIKSYSKKARLQGFRPGKVPTAVIQQIYGRSILVDEVNRLLSESVAKYLEDNEINALGEPLPSQEAMESIDWGHQKDFELVYTIGMAGPFTCALSKKTQVTHHKISSIAKQTIDSLVEQLRKTHSTTETVDKSATHDVIHGMLHYPAQDWQVKTELALEKISSQAPFLGLGPGDQVTFEVQEVLQADQQLPEVTPQMYATMLEVGGQATLAVEKIERMTPAALAPEFFDQVLGAGETKSEEEFMDKLRARLIERKQQEADAYLHKAIQTTLLAEAAIALPDELLQRELQKKNPNVSSEQIASYYQNYAKELQWGLLVSKISKDHQLKVTHEEVEEEVQERFRAALGGTESSQLLTAQTLAQLTQNFLQENEGKNYSQVYENVQARKLFALIKDQITLVPQEISAETFDKLVSDQQDA